jgi:hypothetical protein
MPKQSQHPFLDMLAAALSTHVLHSAGHERDPPPVERLLPQGLTEPELRGLIDFFVAADHDMREDRYVAAARHLELAETRIRLAISRGGRPREGHEATLRHIARARDAAERRNSAEGCRAVAEAVRCTLAELRAH